MPKQLTIIDENPLQDRRCFFVKCTCHPGSRQTTIVRTYNGVDDTTLPLYNSGGGEISPTAFKPGDVILVQYMADVVGYHMLDIKATQSDVANAITNGFAKAGYLALNNGDSNDNTEDFTIPSGLSVGYGGAGSSGIIRAKSGFVAGDKKVLTIDDQGIYFGDPLSSDLSNFYMGNGGQTNVISIDDYNEVYSAVAVNTLFNGKDTIFSNVLLNDPTTGDTFLFDLYDTDLSSLVGRFKGTYTDATTITVTSINVKAEMISANYELRIVPNYINSVAIGNRVPITSNNQIAIGTPSMSVEFNSPVVFHLGFDVSSPVTFEESVQMDDALSVSEITVDSFTINPAGSSPDVGATTGLTLAQTQTAVDGIRAALQDKGIML